MKSQIALILASALLATAVVAAEKTPGSASAAVDTALTAGEVRKVDTEQGKLTIKHEAIANLDMPAMTMVFKAAKPDQLKAIKAGDKIQFRAENVAGGIVVTDIQPAN